MEGGEGGGRKVVARMCGALVPSGLMVNNTLSLPQLAGIVASMG